MLKQKSKSEGLSLALYTITLIMILLRKYMVSILRKDIPIDNITSLLFYGSIALLFLQFIIRKKHNITEILIFMFACILYILTREGSILVLILLSISIRDINDKYVVKSYMILNLMFILACMLLGSLAQHIAQIPEVHYRLIEGRYVARETFGFANPNSIFLFLLPVFAGYIFLRFDKYNNIDRILLVSTVLYMYINTRSKTGCLAIIGALILLEILRFVDLKNNKFIQYIIKLSPIIFLIGSILIGTLFKNSDLFNKILSSRPKHWYAYLIEDGSMFTLFGNNYSELVKTSHPLDNSYIYIIAMLGIVSLIFFMYLLYRGLDIFIKNNQKKYIVVVMLFLVYSLAENILLEAGYNFAIILLIKHIMNNNKNDFSVFDFIKKKGKYYR